MKKYRLCIYKVIRTESKLLGYWTCRNLGVAIKLCKSFYPLVSDYCFDIQEVKNEDK